MRSLEAADNAGRKGPPVEALVGAERQGLLVLRPVTHVERILSAAICVGTAEYSIRQAMERAKRRVVSGSQPIGADQAIAHPLANLDARLEGARLFVYRYAASEHPGAYRK